MSPKRYELLLALRYLKGRRKQAFTSIVSFVSVLGIAVGVAALVIALALLTGFQQDIQAKIIGATAHIVIWSNGDAPMAEYDEIVRLTSEVDGVVSAAGVVLQQAAINTSYKQAFATFKGIDPDNTTTDLLDRVIRGSADDLRLRGRLRAQPRCGQGLRGGRS